MTSQDKTAEQLRAWSYCPECGCDEAEFHRDGLRVCDNCGQDYYSTVDYTIAVKKNLYRMFASKNTRSDSGEAVAEIVDAYIPCNSRVVLFDADLPIGTPLFTHPRATSVDVPSFQAGVSEWMSQCFIPSLYSNMTERGDRLLEEVLELLQAHGYDENRVDTLVNYVYGRPVGDPAQEVGGVMVTLAGYCWIAGLNMHAAGDAELARITKPEVMAKIRAKQEAKNALHFDTPLPGNAAIASREGDGMNHASFGNFCACMGPQGGDQYCPCRMQREGLDGYYNCHGDRAALDQRGKEAADRLRAAMLKLRPEPPETV